MWDYLVNKVRPKTGDREYSDVHPVHPADASGATGRVGKQESKSGDDPQADPAHGKKASGSRRLHCPVCSTVMILEYIGTVEVDRCPDCRGIFLDKGELQEIKGRDFSRYQKPETNHGGLIYTPHGLSNRVTGHD